MQQNAQRHFSGNGVQGVILLNISNNYTSSLVLQYLISQRPRHKTNLALATGTTVGCVSLPNHGAMFLPVPASILYYCLLLSQHKPPCLTTEWNLDRRRKTHPSICEDGRDSGWRSRRERWKYRMLYIFLPERLPIQSMASKWLHRGWHQIQLCRTVHDAPESR